MSMNGYTRKVARPGSHRVRPYGVDIELVTDDVVQVVVHFVLRPDGSPDLPFVLCEVVDVAALFVGTYSSSFFATELVRFKQAFTLHDAVSLARRKKHHARA